ncbi:hypothetical protein [Salipiger sp. PrR002]|uniref:hypothetical protein n=1 Tax=Salipiger sp. PrR002 TaxID=2706489 RepID=UPI0013B9667E|nr:hypothetical protein [Salipiger sp. PrR002]NDW01914.1 hypothetical protein [Salipiger sp. PrR002]NDW59008.1 hypothetical protein [Salipiger sp. PrR004]
MKTLIASTLIATAALTGVASAAPSAAANAARVIEASVPNADLSGLSDQQIVAVAHTLQQTEGAAKKIGVTEALIQSLN